MSTSRPSIATQVSLVLSLAALATLVTPSLPAVAEEPALQRAVEDADSEPSETDGRDPVSPEDAERVVDTLAPSTVDIPGEATRPENTGDVDTNVDDNWLLGESTAFMLAVSATASGGGTASATYGSDVTALDGWSVGLSDSAALGIRPDPNLEVDRVNQLMDSIFVCPGVEVPVGVEMDTGR